MSAKVRAPLAALDEGERTLDAASSRYLAGSLRLRAGDRFVAFDVERAREADAVIVHVEPSALIVRIGPLRAAAAVATRAVTWIQGVAKGDKMDAIVRDATELGATRFVPALTTFGVVKLDRARGDARRERWQRIAREAARQSGRGDAPVIDPPCAWQEALAAASTDDARVCLYERAALPLGPLLHRALAEARPLAFAAGPEGGLSGEEALAAEQNGYTLVSLGRFTLRTETVASVVLGAVTVISGSFSQMAPDSSA